MSKIDIDKFIASMINQHIGMTGKEVIIDTINTALKEQGLEFKNGEIVNKKPERIQDFEEMLEDMFEEYADLDRKGKFDTWEETDAFVQSKANLIRDRLYKEFEDLQD